MADVVHQILTLGQFALQPLGNALGILQRSAFGQFHIDHQFESCGGRKELLRNEPEQQHRSHEGGDGTQNHRALVLQTPADPLFELVVKRCPIGILMRGAGLRQPSLCPCGKQMRNTFLEPGRFAFRWRIRLMRIR